MRVVTLMGRRTLSTITVELGDKLATITTEDPMPESEGGIPNEYRHQIVPIWKAEQFIEQLKWEGFTEQNYLN